MKIQNFNKNHFTEDFYLSVLNCKRYTHLNWVNLSIFYQLFLIFFAEDTLDYDKFFNELKAHFLTFNK